MADDKLAVKIVTRSGPWVTVRVDTGRRGQRKIDCGLGPRLFPWRSIFMVAYNVEEFRWRKGREQDAAQADAYFRLAEPRIIEAILMLPQKSERPLPPRERGKS